MCPQATGSRFSAARKKMFMEPRKTRNTKTHSRRKAFSSCFLFIHNSSHFNNHSLGTEYWQPFSSALKALKKNVVRSLCINPAVNA